MYWVILASFLIFFLVIGPALLFWFIRRGSRTLIQSPPSFIGFPQDETGPPSGHDT